MNGFVWGAALKSGVDVTRHEAIIEDAASETQPKTTLGASRFAWSAIEESDKRAIFTEPSGNERGMKVAPSFRVDSD